MNEETKRLIERAVLKNYEELKTSPIGIDGAMQWKSKWYAPMWGCDTLEHLIDDLEYELTPF
jgi:hypothetical protein